MHLNAEPFRKIKEGSQQIESRVNDEKRRKLRTGERIKFVSRDNPENTFSVEIIDLIIAPTFSKLFNAYPPEMFGGKSKEDLMGIYKYYSTQEEKYCGVVGIKVKRIL
jgi:ASC-1-like (ASCH) protein